MTPPARSQSPSAPLAEQSRPAWQRLMGASAKALLAVSPIQRLESIETQLDIKMAQAIRHNDAEAFETHLETIVSFHAADSTAPRPVLALAESIKPFKSGYLSRLLFCGVSPNENFIFNHGPPIPLTLLHKAANEGWSDAVALLIQHGADIHKKDLTGFTPLALAVRSGSLPTVNALIQAKAKLDWVSPVNGLALFNLALPYFAKDDPLLSSEQSLSKKKDKSLIDFSIHGAPIAHALLRAGARCHAPTRPARLVGLLPPLAAAIRMQDRPLISALIQGGADASWLSPLAPDAPASPRSQFLADWLAALSPLLQGPIAFALSEASRRAQTQASFTPSKFDAPISSPTLSPFASEPSASINKATPPPAPPQPPRRILNKRESSAPSLLSEADASSPAAPTQRSVKGFV